MPASAAIVALGDRDRAAVGEAVARAVKNELQAAAAHAAGQPAPPVFDWRQLFTNLTPHGRKLLLWSDPRDVLETAAQCWVAHGGGGWVVRMTRAATYAAMGDATRAELVQRIGQAQTELKADAARSAEARPVSA